MEDRHLTLELLRAIHGGTRNPGDLVPVAMAHLFELCPHCRGVFEAWRQELGEGVADPSLAQYDVAFDRLRAFIRGPEGEGLETDTAGNAGAFSPEERIQGEEAEARRRAAELMALAPRLRADRVRQEPDRFSGPALSDLLIAEARNHLPARPKDAYAVAGLARAVLHHGPPSPYTSELYARALGHQANALRTQGELRRAAELFEVARFLLKPQGGGDRLTRAELDSFEGSLCRAQRRFEEAQTLISRAALAYAMEHRAVEAAGNLISLGMVHREVGDLHRALEVTTQAEELILDEDNPRLLLMARHNLAVYSHEIGEVDRARAILDESQELYDQFPDPWTQLRLLWLQGDLARTAGDVDAAERAYETVRDGFLAQGAGFDAALAALDLAVLYAEERRTAKLKRVAEDLVLVFEAEDIHREAATALMLFQDAVRTEQVTLGYVVELSSYLKRARLDPSLTFQTPT